MDLWRLRVSVSDHAGSLSGLTGCLGAHGIDIRLVDVHLLDGAHVADELLVDLAHRVDPPALERLLPPGAELLDLTRASEHELVDLPARAALAAGRLSGAGAGGIALVCSAVTELVAVDEARLGRPAEAAFGDDRLVVPVPPTGAQSYSLILSRQRPAFTATELARVRALVAACPDPPPDPVIRALRPADRSALRRMHERCSATSRYRRYFTPMVHLSERILERLVGEGAGIVAAFGGEVVAMAHLHRTGATAEVAVLVEDAHQRRGIGSTLVRHLVDHAREHGVGEVVALTLPDNHAIARCLRAAGLAPRATWRDGAVHLAAPC